MKKTFAAALALTVLFGLGCNDKPKDAFVPGQEDAQKPVTTGTTAGTSQPETPAVVNVPTSLQSDGYHYYGLARTEPATYEVTTPGMPTQTGAEVIKFLGVENGKAKFDIQRTGALEDMGSEQVVLDDKGITAVSTSPGKLQGTVLDMPANLSVGTTWKTDYKVDLSGTKLGGSSEDHSNFKVVGTEKVTVKAGTFDALKIESTGNDKRNGSPFTLKTQSWYVKGRGLVKLVVTTVTDGKEASLSVEAAPGDPK